MKLPWAPINVPNYSLLPLQTSPSGQNWSKIYVIGILHFLGKSFQTFTIEPPAHSKSEVPWSAIQLPLVSGIPGHRTTLPHTKCLHTTTLYLHHVRCGMDGMVWHDSSVGFGAHANSQSDPPAHSMLHTRNRTHTLTLPRIIACIILNIYDAKRYSYSIPWHENT